MRKKQLSYFHQFVNDGCSLNKCIRLSACDVTVLTNKQAVSIPERLLRDQLFSDLKNGGSYYIMLLMLLYIADWKQIRHFLLSLAQKVDAFVYFNGASVL